MLLGSLAVALFPFLPESAQKIWVQLGLGGKINDCAWSDLSLLGIKSGHNLGIASPLFTKVEESDIELRKKELGPSDLK